MPVILSMFDNKIGPITVMAVPEYLESSFQERNVKLFDVTSYNDDEIVIKDFSDVEMLSLNLQFQIGSSWARGNHEIIQLTALISNRSPPIQSIESIIRKYRDKLQSIPDLYKAFYKKHPDSKDRGEDECIGQYHDDLERIMVEFNDSINFHVPATNSYVVPMKHVSGTGKLNIPSPTIKILNDMMKENEAKDDGTRKECFFICFKKDPAKSEISISVIPSNTKIIRVMIISTHFSPTYFIQLGNLINLPVVYTRGLCQESADRCTYETYFSFTGDFDGIKGKLASEFEKRKDFIKDFKIEKIEVIDDVVVMAGSARTS
jgi:hypothetical protein